MKRTLKSHYADMLAVLDEVADYLDRYADVVDGDDGQPEPNYPMRLFTALQNVIAEADNIITEEQ
jgi:hypothetical protein